MHSYSIAKDTKEKSVFPLALFIIYCQNKIKETKLFSTLKYSTLHSATSHKKQKDRPKCFLPALVFACLKNTKQFFELKFLSLEKLNYTKVEKIKWNLHSTYLILKILKSYLSIVLFLFHQRNNSKPMEEGQEKEKSQEIMPLFSLLFDLVLEMRKLLIQYQVTFPKCIKQSPQYFLSEDCNKRHLLKFILHINS